MKTRTYPKEFTTYNHDGVKVTIKYSVEGDPDGNIYIIDSIKNVFGEDVEETINDDFMFEVREHYGNMQTEAYMKYGDLI